MFLRLAIPFALHAPLLANTPAILSPEAMRRDVVPFIGNIVGVGTGFVAFLLSLPLSLLVISVAWIFYRPLIGVPLVIAAIAGFVFLISKLMAQKKRQAGLAPS